MTALLRTLTRPLSWLLDRLAGPADRAVEVAVHRARTLALTPPASLLGWPDDDEVLRLRTENAALRQQLDAQGRFIAARFLAGGGDAA